VYQNIPKELLHSLLNTGEAIAVMKFRAEFLEKYGVELGMVDDIDHRNLPKILKAMKECQAAIDDFVDAHIY
jgi:hypothetical protein